MTHNVPLMPVSQHFIFQGIKSSWRYTVIINIKLRGSVHVIMNNVMVTALKVI